MCPEIQISGPRHARYGAPLTPFSRFSAFTAANVPGAVVDLNTAVASATETIAQPPVTKLPKLTTPPPEPLVQRSVAVAVTGKEIYQTPPREVLRQISPIMSPATISKNELNDAALTLKFLSEGWNSVDGKGNTKRPRSERRASTGLDASMVTPTGEWAGNQDDGLGEGYDDEQEYWLDEQTPIQYSGKSKRAASRKCVALLKEALFEESQQVLRPQTGARSSFGTSSSFSAGKLVPGTAVKGGAGGAVGGNGDAAGGVGPNCTPTAASKGKGGKNVVPKVMLAKGSKKKGVAGGEGRKRSRNYSENSRVGRAVQNIYKYIIEHQTTYLNKGAKGVPERVIREEYGNNPDTSKALRYLVSENRINKEGAGGRRDPFSYTIRSVPPSAAQTAEYDPKDKKTSLLRSLGMPPPELCVTPRDSLTASAFGGAFGPDGPSGSTPAAAPRDVSTSSVAVPSSVDVPQANRQKGILGEEIRLVDPPVGTTHEHHPAFEVSPVKEEESNQLLLAPKQQSGKFQPRLSFGDVSKGGNEANLPSLPLLPSLPAKPSLPALPLLNSTVIDPAKAAELQSSFLSADKETQTAMMVQVQTALLNQTVAMMNRISNQQTCGGDGQGAAPPVETKTNQK